MNNMVGEKFMIFGMVIDVIIGKVDEISSSDGKGD